MKKKQKKCFAEKLSEKLRSANLGEVTEDSFNDNSARWVNIRIKNKDLCVVFDMKGENITELGVWKDKIEVTGTINIFGK